MKAKIDKLSCKVITAELESKFRKEFYVSAFKRVTIRMKNPISGRQEPEMIAPDFCRYLA